MQWHQLDRMQTICTLLQTDNHTNIPSLNFYRPDALPDTHTHTRLTALCPGLPRWAGTRKVKPIWILLEQDSERQWHQLEHMQVCTSLQTDNHASTSLLKFFTGWMPFLPPNQQCQSTEGKCSSWHSPTNQQCQSTVIVIEKVWSGCRGLPFISCMIMGWYHRQSSIVFPC